jgi:hypothetical protein
MRPRIYGLPNDRAAKTQAAAEAEQTNGSRKGHRGPIAFPKTADNTSRRRDGYTGEVRAGGVMVYRGALR